MAYILYHMIHNRSCYNNYRELEAGDKFIIIASDGVFEFLTNQMVADECAHHSDPLVACKAVVAQAYHLWLQYEVRTDDITMIAIYIDDMDGGAVPSSLSKTASAAAATAASTDISRQTSLDMGEQRPVRRVMSREKRKNMIEVQSPAADDSEDELTEAETQAITVPKSDRDIELIGAAIKSNFLFQHLNAAQRTAVINVMREVPVKAGDRVIRQGDRGDRFYVVDHGRFEVRVRMNMGPTAEEAAKEAALKASGGLEKALSIISIDRAPTASKIVFEPNLELLGNVVHVYESGPNSHPGFGELSLM